MRFWDSPALMPLFVIEPSTAIVRRWFAADPRIVVWTLTRVELLSGIARRRRERAAAERPLTRARQQVLSAWNDWFEVTSLDTVRAQTERLVALHPLRAGNALQLGAARIAAHDRPAKLPFVTLDDRQAEAAEREGFRVLRPTT